MDLEVSKLKFQRELDSITGQGSEFTARTGWQIRSTEYPLIRVVFVHARSTRAVGFQFTCDNWDELPPSLALFDPATETELGWDKWPQNGWAAGNFHPTTGKPFLCLPGIREYHTHSSHLNDKWDGLRGRDSYRLAYIIERVRQRFGDTNG